MIALAAILPYRHNFNVSREDIALLDFLARFFVHPAGEEISLLLRRKYRQRRNSFLFALGQKLLRRGNLFGLLAFLRRVGRCVRRDILVIIRDHNHNFIIRNLK